MSHDLTVVIPTHNRAPLLAQAIESVLRSPLIRSPLQIIVVDDASTDATPAVAAKSGVRYERVVGKGPSRTRNLGLAMADTEFVAFLDDDDCWLPGNMEPQLAALLATPEAAFAYGRTQRTTMDLVPFGEPFPSPALQSRSPGARIVQRPPQLGVVLFRRALVSGHGGFDEALRYAEDVDLLVGLAFKHPVVAVDIIGSAFRQREPSPADAEGRWLEYQDVLRLHRKWNASDSPVSRSLRMRAGIEYRGRAAYLFCQDASAAADASRPRDALRYLLYALRISAPHALLRSPAFWKTLRCLWVQRRPPWLGARTP